MKKLKTVITILIVLFIAIFIILSCMYSKTELKTVSSKKTLNRLYNNYSINGFTDYLIRAITMPWSLSYNFIRKGFSSDIVYNDTSLSKIDTAIIR